jgi:fumarylacetoacetase
MATASAAEIKVQKSWVTVPEGSHFPIQNLPYGTFELSSGDNHVGVRIGDHILDLYECASAGLFSTLEILEGGACFLESRLNAFMALPRDAWTAARIRITELLSADCDTIRDDKTLREKCLIECASVAMRMPCAIGDYTDFYASRNHAYNVGVMFRGKDNALQPNWLHLPVGYHGRASSVVVSGTPIRRPNGQLAPGEDGKPGFGPCRLFDFELEMGFLMGGALPKMGTPIDIDEAYDNIFGVVLMNDWSARDIQKWEYIPLGPFNGKNFGTTISPWIVTLDALEPFACALPEQEPKPLPYLCGSRDRIYDISLRVQLQTEKMEKPQTISVSNLRHLYWSFQQQLAHHTSTGCPFRAGDLCGTGTISGTDRSAYGSMLEISWKGTTPLKLSDGTERKFLADGDKLILSGECRKETVPFSIGFGTCEGVVLPAHELKHKL